MFATLANRRFTAYLLAAASADTGWWICSIAQGWLVLRLTNSPFWLGAIAASAQLPFLLFSLAGGDAADRFDRRALVAIGNAAIAVLALVIAALVATHTIAIWSLALLVFAIGSIVAIEHPIDRAWVYDLVGGERLGTAITLSSLEWSVARTAGPAIGGLAVAFIGIAPGYVAFALMSIPIVVLALVLGHRGSGGASGDDGATAAGDDAAIVPFCVMIATFTIGVAPYISQLPAIAHHGYGLDARGYGLFAAAGGIGAITGAVTLAARGEIARLGRVVPIAAGVGSLLLLAFALTTNALAAVLLLAAMGFVDTLMYALANTYVQRLASAERRGHANAVFSLAFLGGIPVGNVGVGALASIIGSSHALAVSAIVAAAGCATFWFAAPRSRDAQPCNVAVTGGG